ncbi:MAG: hypothetical protein ACR2JW_01755 [Thermomicrobiales bacterium]
MPSDERPNEVRRTPDSPLRTSPLNLFEQAESAYRRGYRDGWVQAMDAFHDLLPRWGREGAYSACWNFWLRALCRWVKDDCTRARLPPPFGE